jgi:tetratricopeptide (TPR) repeat protein
VTHFILALLIFPAPSVTPSSHEMGDREFSHMNYLQAVALYDSVLATSADSAVVLWRIARAWTCLADTTTSGSKLELYKRALAFARRSVRADSLNSEAHAWLAATTGNIAMFEGGEKKVRLCRVIKKEIDVAIKLDSSNDVAYSILGSFYKALGDVSWVEKQLAAIFLGGLPDGGYEESDVAFRKAIELAPDVIRNHYELGKVYMCLDRNREALIEFRRVLSLPVSIGMDRQMKHSAGELAREMEH